MHKKVPHSQAIERSGRRPIDSNWVDIKKVDGRHRRRLVAQEVKKKVQTLESGNDDGKQVRIFNRILIRGATGIECEADQKHAGALVHKKLKSKDRPASAPGQDMNDNVSESV